ncbi:MULTISPECIES: NAD(P)H-binding protein [Protofrankia]|uniref:NAD(P)-binding domain-containing protein n=1 Tax=Protofrankia coriariae TaxID=1562887 RepID=A0ABR5F789_9ACTN|nr:MULTISPECIES: NAD(P)H-binding protein [Protofrankia]KLL12538.1 hypothetical protein FrCorBMG51_04655 [Protofrankia coriariae]ONH35440.1 hypothetical protein BL254_10780 [Protofrankia sp. BMG5.30]
MARILELSPLFSEAGSSEFHIVNGVWNAREQAERQALARGHTYTRLADGGHDRAAVAEALAAADAVILAPGSVPQPASESAGRALGQRLLAQVSEALPAAHIVLVSHFLVGHGITHRNAKPGTWALRAFEAHLRGGPNPWTILRPTWLSTRHDVSYQTRLTQDPHADGLVSTESIGAAAVTAIEHPEVAAGRTASIFNLSIPAGGDTDLAAQYAALDPDFEYTALEYAKAGV